MCIFLQYRSKRNLKNSVGKRLYYAETSIHGPEYCDNGVLFGFGEHRKNGKPEISWHAKVTMADGLISAVE